MRWIGILGAALLVASAGSIARADPATACKDSPRVVDACFTVHGRLSAWNGAPTFRILRLGTNRILGVEGAYGDPENAIPPSVKALVLPDAFRVDLIGDYLVCPFTKERPGSMRIVCIADASGLVARRR